MASRSTKASVDHNTVDAGVKQYAGKTNLAEVFVTGLRRLGDDTHAVTLHWPCTHAYYATAQGYSPLLFVESVRQALSVISYMELDVPIEHRMSWEFLASDITSEALRVDSDASQVEVVVTHESITRRKLGSVRLSARARATRGGVPLGTATVHYTGHPPVLYKRFRGRNADAEQAFARALPPPPPIAAHLVGRTLERDVVLAPVDAPAEAPRRWLLRADTTHPVLFDHPHDHIPGMVLLEAACQAVQADAAPERITPVSVNATFRRYVELDLPCRLTADLAGIDEMGRRRQTVTGLQEDNVAFTVVVATEPAR